MTIHPTAVIDPKAEIDGEVDIGPYVVIEGPVKIKRGTYVMAHAYLTGWTEIGADNEIHPGAMLGNAPQDKAYKGAETYLKIGDRNIFREHIQVHRGTVAGSSTVVGDDNFLMANPMSDTTASSVIKSSSPTARSWAAMWKWETMSLFPAIASSISSSASVITR